MADSLIQPDPTPIAPEPTVEPEKAGRNGDDVKPPPPRRGPDPNRTYRGRFGLGYLALIVLIAGAGIGIWKIVDEKSSSQATGRGGGDSWAAWQPERAGLLGAKEIARQVGDRYRLPNGREITATIAERPNVQEVPIVFMVNRPTTARFDNDITVLETGNAIQYMLCGLGPGCSIASGTPSAERAQLLRREALELALRTFHNDAAIENVLVFLPPRNEQNATTYALVFRRRDLAQALSKPLADTLPQRPRYLSTQPLPQKEASTVDSLSEPSLYSYTFTQGADGTPILILNPQSL